MVLRVAVVVGTRPEAIKLAPVCRALADDPATEFELVLTGQHRELAAAPLAEFGLPAGHELKIGRFGPTSTDKLASTIAELGGWLENHPVDWLVVQGDTTSALAGALVGMTTGIPVAHVEAGLRTGDVTSPFPEEHHRRAIASVAALHFPPTAGAQANLMAEGVERGHAPVVGNTVIDALWWMRERLTGRELGELELPSERRLGLLTVHRRETQGAPMRRVLDAIAKVVATRAHEWCFVVPVHPNPTVSELVHDRLDGRPGIHLVQPLSYREMVAMLSSVEVVVTDSGGLQEEAPALGVPVLVLRGHTERREAVTDGGVELLGTDPLDVSAGLVAALARARSAKVGHRQPSPYGDGRASQRIVDALANRPVRQFVLDCR